MEEEELVGFDKTIADELDTGALEAKREFLMKFLSRKLVELMRSWPPEEQETLEKRNQLEQ